MTENKPTNIAFNKTILYFMAIGCILVALVLFFNRNNAELNMGSSLIFYIIWGCILLFGFGGFKLLYKTFGDNQPAIEFNPKGMIIHSLQNEKLNKYVLWKDVADIEMGANGKIRIKYKDTNLDAEEITSYLFNIPKQELFKVLYSYAKQYGDIKN